MYHFEICKKKKKIMEISSTIKYPILADKNKNRKKVIVVPKDHITDP